MKTLWNLAVKIGNPNLLNLVKKVIQTKTNIVFPSKIIHVNAIIKNQNNTYTGTGHSFILEELWKASEYRVTQIASLYEAPDIYLEFTKKQFIEGIKNTANIVMITGDNIPVPMKVNYINKGNTTYNYDHVDVERIINIRKQKYPDKKHPQVIKVDKPVYYYPHKIYPNINKNYY